MVGSRMSLVGESSSFAIEFDWSKVSNLMAVRVWIQNFPIGTLDDETYVPTFCHQLDRLVHPPTRLKETDVLIDSDVPLVSLGDTFDDFIVRSCLIGDDLFITMRQVESPFFQNSAWEGQGKIQFRIRASIAQIVVEEFFSRLRSVMPP